MKSVVSDPNNSYFTIQDGSLPGHTYLKVVSEFGWPMPEVGCLVRVLGHPQLDGLRLRDADSWMLVPKGRE